MAATASQSKQLYTIRPYGKAFLIECTNCSMCEFYGEPIHTPSDDLTLFFHPQTNGWIVRGSEGRLAKRWVKEENQRFEAAQTLTTMGGARDDNFTLERYGRGYLIKCSNPTECPWWGSEYIALSNTEGAGTAFWNAKLGGYIVRNRDADEAEYFVHLANHPKAPRTSAPTTPPRRSKRVSPPPAPRKTRTFPTDATDGGEVRFLTPTIARRLFRNPTELEMKDPVGLYKFYNEAARRVSNKNYEELNDIQQAHVEACAWDSLEEADEAGEVVWGGEAMEEDSDSDYVSSDEDDYVSSDEEDDYVSRDEDNYVSSDSDYVPSDEETDDDAEFDEATSEGPYTGMTLRSRGRGGYRRPAYYLTCAASHRLHGRPFLGHPAARAVRANCWEVNSEAVQQFLDGGAKMEE